MKKAFFLFLFMPVICVLCDIQAEDNHYSFLEELFGRGLPENLVKKEAKRHLGCVSILA